MASAAPELEQASSNEVRQCSTTPSLRLARQGCRNKRLTYQPICFLKPVADAMGRGVTEELPGFGNVGPGNGARRPP